MSKNLSSNKRALILCILIFCLSIIGAALELGPPNAWMLFGIGVVAIIVFFWALSGATSSNKTENVRNAIACSMVLTYLLLVVSLVFYNIEMDTLPQASQVLLTSFTTTVGIVIASYFGAAAFIEARKPKE